MYIIKFVLFTCNNIFLISFVTYTGVYVSVCTPAIGKILKDKRGREDKVSRKTIIYICMLYR